MLDGTVVLEPRRLARESDDEVVARLTAVRGIGEWTAQMFLMFQLRRLDVWPVGDLGVRKGYGRAWGVPMPTAKELLPLGRAVAPVPVGGGLVLLAGLRGLCRRRRQRADPLTPGKLLTPRKKALLVVQHTVSPSTHALHLAAVEGAQDPSIEGVDVVVRAALTATAVDALAADGYLLGGPVNLGYLAGALKHFFDQIYYPCLEVTRGRPWGVWLHANNDATGALKALDTITTGLGWRRAQAPLVVAGDPEPAELDAARELGAALAAGLVLED